MDFNIDDGTPRKPGTWKVVMGGPSQPYEVDLTCEYCNRVFHSEGWEFGPQPECPLHDFEHCTAIHCHWGEDCPHPKWKWHRFWHQTMKLDRIEMKFQQRKWNRKHKKERNDPEAWAKYWEEGGK